MGDNFTMIFDLIALACGGYCIFTYVKLRMAGKLFPNGLLVPSGKKPKDCTDEVAFIGYIGPRLLALGVITAVFGVIGLLNSYLHLFGLLVSELMTGLAFAAVVWYAVCNSRANKRFWNF